MNLSTQVLHHPEFLKHLGPKALTWLADLFTIMTWEQRIPKIWRQEKIIALTKPGKDPHLAASYRPISLLSICYKQLERANLQRISPRVRNKLKVQNSSTFQGPKLHFSSTKIIDKKPYPRCGHSKFRLQCDTEVYWTVLTNTVMIKAKFQHLQDLNSGLFKDFQVLSSTLSVFKHFQGPWSFLFQIQAFSRISQACYEPCSPTVEDLLNVDQAATKSQPSQHSLSMGSRRHWRPVQSSWT